MIQVSTSAHEVRLSAVRIYRKWRHALVIGSIIRELQKARKRMLSLRQLENYFYNGKQWDATVCNGIELGALIQRYKRAQKSRALALDFAPIKSDVSRFLTTVLCTMLCNRVALWSELLECNVFGLWVRSSFSPIVCSWLSWPIIHSGLVYFHLFGLVAMLNFNENLRKYFISNTPSFYWHQSMGRFGLVHSSHEIDSR